MAVPADWYADPAGKHQYRYWDGSAWTDNVADAGQASVDPLVQAPAVPQPATPPGPVEFDAEGHVASIAPPKQGPWAHSTSGSAQYYARQADSLFEAAEILKGLESIPGMTYYLVDTPDGTLGRDIGDFFTEKPIKTKNLKVASPVATSEKVEFSSLKSFGDGFKSQAAVANMKALGQYANFILLMECRRCGYQSPVETEGGHLERQCYCCGAMNSGPRATIKVVSGNGKMIEI
jgi:hypothetical protein